MKNNNLPIADLQKYGIINDDQTFNEKLKPEDIEKFLQGYTIVADHAQRRATFQLINDQKLLKVILLERDRNLIDVLKTSINEIQYSGIKDITMNKDTLAFEKKAFVYDPISKNVVEYDLLKNISELTQIVLVKDDPIENNRYKTELLKLKGFLQNKIDLFPNMAKEIILDLNIVSKEISTVNGFSSSIKNTKKSNQTKIELNVNDPDIEQDAASLRAKNERTADDEIITARKR